MDGPVTSEMRVAEIIERYPSTIDVFVSHGCPVMRDGVFKVMCRVMRLRWAAAMHRIPLSSLLAELNHRVLNGQPTA